MTLTLIADTHQQHERLVDMPKADVLIHAGDFCHGSGGYKQAKSFLEWFARQDFKHKLLIAGNHDFFADEHPADFRAIIPAGITYLEDKGLVIEGVRFWGSPVQPDLIGWAFGRPRGAAMNKHWSLIPKNTDVLITHTPPVGILDRSRRGTSLGCEELAKAVQTIQPKLHVFGHIHNGYGQVKTDQTHYINAACMRSGAGLDNAPVFVHLD